MAQSQTYGSSETDNQSTTEYDSRRQGKTGLLCNRTGRQPLKRNKDYLW
jgi:hypothetical protein